MIAAPVLEVFLRVLGQAVAITRFPGCCGRGRVVAGNGERRSSGAVVEAMSCCTRPLTKGAAALAGRSWS
jgi:hypothetical protein